MKNKQYKEIPVQMESKAFEEFVSPFLKREKEGQRQI